MVKITNEERLINFTLEMVVAFQRGRAYFSLISLAEETTFLHLRISSTLNSIGNGRKQQTATTNTTVIVFLTD